MFLGALYIKAQAACILLDVVANDHACPQFANLRELLNALAEQSLEKQQRPQQQRQ